MSGCDSHLVASGRPDKTRPVLVLTRSSIIPHLSTVTVAPITRTVRGIASEVAVGDAEGLKQPSVVNLDSLQTISAGRLGRYLGSIDRRRKAEIREALLFGLELE